MLQDDGIRANLHQQIIYRLPVSLRGLLAFLLEEEVTGDRCGVHLATFPARMPMLSTAWTGRELLTSSVVGHHFGENAGNTRGINMIGHCVVWARIHSKRV